MAEGRREVDQVPNLAAPAVDHPAKDHHDDPTAYFLAGTDEVAFEDLEPASVAVAMAQHPIEFDVEVETELALKAEALVLFRMAYLSSGWNGTTMIKLARLTWRPGSSGSEHSYRSHSAQQVEREEITATVEERIPLSAIEEQVVSQVADRLALAWPLVQLRCASRG